MKLVLTEKPSVARDIARFLGATTKQQGYLEGNDYQVTWALGHLVTLKEPEDYDPKLRKWKSRTLPFIPSAFELKLIKGTGVKRQFDIIKRLLKEADEIICATDAGREGELIFRYILDLSGCADKPFKRLWLSSLTHEAIGKAFDDLKAGNAYDRLYAAARCRSEADWIVGLNATCNFTIRYGRNRVLWSVGRVQTPVLALIVKRDDTIRHFVSQPFWELITQYRDCLFRYTGDAFFQRKEAEALLKKVNGQHFLINSIKAKEEIVKPPLLFDLTSLQREMNGAYGYSAAVTLKIAQKLYENKLISYPRTDSRFLSTDMRKLVPSLLEKLEAYEPEAVGRLDLRQLKMSGRIFFNARVTDHHAIIPTGKLPKTLKVSEKNVYRAITIRFIAVFYPPCLKIVTLVKGKAAKTEFQAKGVQIIDPGWTFLYPKKKTGKDDPNTDRKLPDFSEGEEGVHNPELKEGNTKPLPHYYESSLLLAMETAGKMVEEEELKAALKDKGLGTPATRAAIIEILVNRGYISRNGRQLVATEMGRYLIAVIENEILKSPEMTGEWEQKLKQIEYGEIDPAQFITEVVDFTRHIIKDSGSRSVDDSCIGPCPRCGAAMIEISANYCCAAVKRDCAYVLNKGYKGINIDLCKARQLFQYRRLDEPVRIEGGDETQECMLILTADGILSELPLPSSSLGQCPLCRHEVIETNKAYGCSNWKNGCTFVIWKWIARKRITQSLALELIKKNETPLLTGFVSKAGKPFRAKLKLVDGRVTLVF